MNVVCPECKLLFSVGERSDGRAAYKCTNCHCVIRVTVENGEVLIPQFLRKAQTKDSEVRIR